MNRKRKFSGPGIDRLLKNYYTEDVGRQKQRTVPQDIVPTGLTNGTHYWGHAFVNIAVTAALTLSAVFCLYSFDRPAPLDTAAAEYCKAKNIGTKIQKIETTLFEINPFRQ
ncbi:hypothetical protein ACFL6L_01465 [candidate division KSB1 bacterium]